MRKSTPEPARPDGARADTDTSSTAQPHGALDAAMPAQRQNERLPHERDESAGATGDRLKENPPPSDRQITRARKDVDAGRVDTDRRGVPSDVPKSS
jgi:hypothetical protein